jgi:3-deoxy-D-manno-octulosonate 8-phosphate phosphatase (KDO 8-P phosphatase)
MTPKKIRSRARKIKLLLMDVDGVMTDGRIYYVPNPKGGMFETKTFHARDGLALRIAHENGLQTGIITGRSSPVIDYRVKELGIHYLFQKALDKLVPYERVKQEAGVTDAEIAYVGDDIVDLPILKRAGFAVGVAGGDETLRRHVHYWTKAPGGLGAVRETIEVILSAQGKWEKVLNHYLR